VKPCQGIVGRLFGHKFSSDHPGRFFPEFTFHDHCVRCGMPKGGWSDDTTGAQ
jgi:hypothetical protein